MRIGNNSEPLRVPENHMYKWLFHTCKLINHRSTKSIYEYAYGHQYQQYTNHTCIVLMIQHANAHEKKNKNTQWTGKAWGLQNIGSTRASTTSTKTKHGWHTLTPLGPQKHIQFCTDPLPKFVGIGHPPAHSLYLGPPKLHNLCIHRFRPFTHKSSQSKAKHAITKQNEQNSYKIIEFTTYWMKMVQIITIKSKTCHYQAKWTKFI